MKYQAILGMPPLGCYSLKKERLFLPYLSLLTEKHRNAVRNTAGFKNIRLQPGEGRKIEKLEQIPMIPVSPFQRRRS